ncbi:hypothetical protein GW915_02030 [bacterium]|nr:hypothetical protein [bacterium]
MKKTLIYFSAITTVLTVGAGYFSNKASAKDGTKQTVSVASSARYAADTLNTQGAAVLCGDPTSSSSSVNLNRLLEDVGRYHNQRFNIAPMETTAGVCLFLSSSN